MHDNVNASKYASEMFTLKWLKITQSIFFPWNYRSLSPFPNSRQQAPYISANLLVSQTHFGPLSVVAVALIIQSYPKH